MQPRKMVPPSTRAGVASIKRVRPRISSSGNRRRRLRIAWSRSLMTAAPVPLAATYGAMALALPVTLLLSNPELESCPA